MHAQSPKILQIHRETPKDCNESAYREIEQDTARLCATLGCPHPYLGAESLSEPKEVWFFNGYESTAEQKVVIGAYAKNIPLMTALEKNRKRKASLVGSPITALAIYRPDLSRGVPWMIGQGRFLVVSVTKAEPPYDGTVFEGADGTRFIVIPFQVLKDAERKASDAGQDSHVLAIRPAWSFPAKEWTNLEVELWQPNSKP